MPAPEKPPVATLRGITLPGTATPAAAEDLHAHVSVLRPHADGKGWRRVPPRPGMPIHAGDVLRLRGDAFAALGARAFVVNDSILAGPGAAPPSALELHAHELVHQMQQGAPSVSPMNEGEADAIDRQAKAIEDMVHHRPPTDR